MTFSLKTLLRGGYPMGQIKMSQPIDFYSHKIGPNPWKTVIVFEELRIPYTIQYLEFGDAKGGVEHPEFLKQNAAGRVPLIRDPNTGIVLTESNVIDQYLVDHYDNGKILTVDGGQDLYLVNKWLGFQASTQAPFYAQVLQLRAKGNRDGEIHFQGLVKRTLRTVDSELRGKSYLVGEACSLADLAFVPWDLILDLILQGDKEAATAEARKSLYPNWFAWHSRLVARATVQKVINMQKKINDTA